MLIRAITLCALAAASSFAAADPVDIPSPLVASVNQPYGYTTVLDRAADSGAIIAALGTLPESRIRNFPLGPGLARDIILSPIDVLAPGAVFVDGTTGAALARPQVTCLRGTVAGEENSTVFLSFSIAGTYGFVSLGERTLIISSGRWDSDGTINIYDPRQLPAGVMPMNIPSCGGAIDPTTDPRLQVGSPHDDGSVSPAVDPCGVARLAIETDYEFLNRIFGGNTTNANAYITQLFAAMSTIYSRDVGVSFQIPYVRLWTSNNDPYPDGSDVNTRLSEFTSYWINNMGSVSRHSSFMLTGQQAGAGGVAYLSTVCSTYQYGVAGYLGGGFPSPLQNYNWGNWDLMVTAHELGHNFGAPHTHDVSPQIDGCGTNNCSQAYGGTIMSYCHVCSGGMSNIQLAFHPRTISESMLPFIDNLSGCGIRTTRGPGFQIQPNSANLVVSQSYIMEVSSSGASSYQWKRNGVNINGARLPRFGYSSWTRAQAGNFTCVVSNDCGTRESAVATITVSCPADFNNDGTVDFFDYLDFVAAFSGGASGADFNRDGTVDFFDYLDFVAAFSSTCV
jgi:hypothetical protein